MAKKKPAPRKHPAKAETPPPFKVPRFDTPAFPRALTGRDPVGQSGMTLRDYFAAQALIGILGSRSGGFLVDVGTDNAPGWAYQVADKMLEARKA